MLQQDKHFSDAASPQRWWCACSRTKALASESGIVYQMVDATKPLLRHRGLLRTVVFPPRGESNAL
jgi:hypothetical protein